MFLGWISVLSVVVRGMVDGLRASEGGEPGVEESVRDNEDIVSASISCNVMYFRDGSSICFHLRVANAALVCILSTSFPSTGESVVGVEMEGVAVVVVAVVALAMASASVSRDKPKRVANVNNLPKVSTMVTGTCFSGNGKYIKPSINNCCFTICGSTART